VNFFRESSEFCREACGSTDVKQGDCQVGKVWELLGVRFWLFRSHWSSCQKTKMMQCALVYCNLWKQKISSWSFIFCQHYYLTWQNWRKCFRRDVLTSQRYNLP